MHCANKNNETGRKSSHVFSFTTTSHVSQHYNVQNRAESFHVAALPPEILQSVVTTDIILIFSSKSSLKS